MLAFRRSGGVDGTNRQGLAQRTGEIMAYRNVEDIPSTRELMIQKPQLLDCGTSPAQARGMLPDPVLGSKLSRVFVVCHQVDQKNEAVLLPIYGLMVPFHMSTIKNANVQQDGGHSYIRIIFNVPSAGFTATDMPVQKFPDAVYLKECSFRSSDTKHSNQVVQLIKTISRQVRQRDAEKAERATLVTQERLQLAKGKALRLPDLWIRPAFGGRGRKLTGTLEAHANGFRYGTVKADERVDVLYSNIKHAFFQPAENEQVTILHFHLHNPIMVGNKKAKDVQFYVEVMEANQTLGGGRKSMYDPDEIEEEQRERERRNKINQEFQSYVKRVQDQWERDFKDLDLEFDIPFRELGFYGVPFKDSSFIVPSVNCLVNFIDTPFLVVTLNEIEIVNLERVGLGQKTLDMAIVFKDFKRESYYVARLMSSSPHLESEQLFIQELAYETLTTLHAVMRINAIPSTSLDSIKEWLNSMNIKYYESRLNLNWKTILKAIAEDPDKFLADGGWEFLNIEGSDSEEEGSQESDEGYQPSDAEVASESSASDEDDESVVDSEEEGASEDEEEGEEEDEGLDWDEMEERAKKEDRERGEESDSEDDSRRKRGRAGAASRGRAAPPPVQRRPNGSTAGRRPPPPNPKRQRRPDRGLASLLPSLYLYSAELQLESSTWVLVGSTLSYLDRNADMLALENPLPDLWHGKGHGSIVTVGEG
eukprot:SM000204S05849  [mRNA]  locus=s204:8425:11196:- [translate_table: standard]